MVCGGGGGEGAQVCAPTIQTFVCKISRFCGAIFSPTLDVIPLNSVSYRTPGVSMDVRLLLFNKS